MPEINARYARVKAYMIMITAPEQNLEVKKALPSRTCGHHWQVTTAFAGTYLTNNTPVAQSLCPASVVSRL